MELGRSLAMIHSASPVGNVTRVQVAPGRWQRGSQVGSRASAAREDSRREERIREINRGQVSYRSVVADSLLTCLWQELLARSLPVRGNDREMTRYRPLNRASSPARLLPTVLFFSRVPKLRPCNSPVNLENCLLGFWPQISIGAIERSFPAGFSWPQARIYASHVQGKWVASGIRLCWSK
jgi:hypothetical protein